MKNFLKNYKKYIQTGFTLVEMIIVIAIIAIISALTLFNSSKLNSTMLLSDTAYEISLIIRDAQISGLGSKVTSSEGGVATTSNQGVYIDADPLKSEQIIFFADKVTKDNQYTPGEENQIYNIENRRAGKILSVCIINAENQRCDTSNVTKLNIIFKRPNPEAYFYYYDGTKNNEPHPGSVVINLGFVGAECKSIIVYKTGAIQIDKSYCPQ